MNVCEIVFWLISCVSSIRIKKKKKKLRHKVTLQYIWLHFLNELSSIYNYPMNSTVACKNNLLLFFFFYFSTNLNKKLTGKIN